MLNAQSCKNRRHSTQLLQVGSKVMGKKTLWCLGTCKRDVQIVYEYEIKGKNEIPNVPTLSNLLHKCSSTSYQVNMKQDFVCKDGFCVFAISFHTTPLNLGKTAESHKNFRNTNYKEESL